MEVDGYLKDVLSDSVLLVKFDCTEGDLDEMRYSLRPSVPEV